jgi:hypothetical protein
MVGAGELKSAATLSVLESNDFEMRINSWALGSVETRFLVRRSQLDGRECLVCSAMHQLYPLKSSHRN